ncbi:MAG: MMPL family transporter [SAR202 cluster bacterium]|nr:MMPL family transporter [SAR202 cluster bacterium]
MAINLSTENLARASATHPWRVVGIWLVIIIASMVMVAGFLEDGLTTKFVFVNDPEVQHGEKLLEEIRGPKGTNEAVVFESTKYTVDDPEYKQAVESLTANLAALGPDIIRLETLGNFYSTGSPVLVSGNRAATLIAFVMAGDFDENSKNIEEVVAVVHESAEVEKSGFDIKITGQATIGLDSRKITQEDLEKGESLGVPIALIILVVVLGAVVAALVPLVMAIVSIILALGISALVGQFFELSLFVSNIITMIGLAVGIDYSLFVVSRYREERGRGMDKIDAISRAGATATRAVVFSGITVVLALIGMVLIPFNIFISIGLGASFVVIAAMAAAMTLLPAILGIMGDKVNSLRIPFIGKGQVAFEPNQSGGFWDKLVRVVMAQPVISLLITSGLLIAATIPFFSINTGFAGVSTFPDKLESKQAFLVLDEKFSFGEVTPAEIVIEGDIASAPVQAGIQRLIELLATDDAFSEPRDLEVSASGRIALLAVPVEGDTSGEISIAAVTRLDDLYVEEAFAGTDTNIYVSGETAFNKAFFDVSSNSAKIVFPFVLGISFLLLLVVFRSIVLPIKAIILNLMAVGAAYGILVLVFQKGFLASTFRLQESPTIESWIPLFLFSILFGLSMDYHVFLLSRIRERYDETHDTPEAVAFGIRSTGRLITGAGLIMVAVFWGFSTGSLVGMQQMGFGLGLAILVDASIVRIVMVPASMKLLGKWNWYLPSWLEWMPDLRVEATAPAQVLAAADD